MNKSALVLGATGLVGKHLIKQLCADHRYSQVTCLLRKPLPARLFTFETDKLQPIVVDYEQLQDYQGYFSVDHVYVCLGTTLKKAGSPSEFRKVDYQYVHVAAQLARAQRAKSFVWISSVGANAKSRIFYLRVKGEIENAVLTMLGLNNPSAVRPSLILGARSETRFGEKLGAQLLNLIRPFLFGKLAKFKPVEAQHVAAQMIKLHVFK
jgi:uncharacterized protein YbjT (DUF2867 family)